MLIRTTCAIDENFFFLSLGDSCFYLLKDAGDLHLIDCGSSVHVPQLLKRISALGYAPGDIKHIYLSNTNAARIAGLPYLLEEAGDAQVHAGQTLCLQLQDQAFLDSLYQENQRIADLYRLLPYRPVDKNRFGQAFKRAAPFPDGETIKLATHPFRIYATPGHDEHSSAFYLPESGVLVADQTFGYFRGKDDPAPGADFSLQASLASQEKLKNLEIKTVGFPYIGFITGTLASKHLSSLQEISANLGSECVNARRAGVPESEIQDSLREALYSPTPLFTDPLFGYQLERSFQHIWTQLNRP